jgi:hypothetical protein
MGMRELFIVVALLVAGFFFMTTCVDRANAKETTTLEDALERPVEVKKFVDKELGVVCYYVGRNPDYLNCVKVEDDTRD